MKPAIAGAEKSAKGSYKRMIAKKRRCSDCMRFMKDFSKTKKLPCTGKKGDPRMCSPFLSRHKADMKSAHRLRERLSAFVNAQVCPHEVCATIGKCPRSLCDKCQQGRSLAECKKARKCGKGAKQFAACSKKRGATAYNSLLTRQASKEIMHFRYSNKHQMKFNSLEQNQHTPGGDRKFRKRGANGKVTVNIKDVAIQFVKTSKRGTVVRFQINRAEAISLNKKGKQQRTPMDRMVRREFFAKVARSGKVIRFWHSQADPGNVVLLKAKLASMIGHFAPRASKALASQFTTEREDLEGAHLIQTRVTQKANGCSVHHSVYEHTTADQELDQGMQFDHETTKTMTFCGGRIHHSKLKSKKKTAGMSRDGAKNPRNALTGKKSQSQTMSGTQIKSKDKAVLQYVCTERGRLGPHGKRCPKRFRHAARKGMKKPTMSKMVTFHMDELLQKTSEDKLELAQSQAHKRSTQSPQEHVHMLAHAVNLLNTDPAVQNAHKSAAYEGGTNSDGHHMLKQLMLEDTTGGLHHEAANVLRDVHPTIVAKDKTKHRILSMLSNAHHGASQAVRLALMQDTSLNQIPGVMKNTLFYNFGASRNPIKEAREYVTQMAKQSATGSMWHTAANSVRSIFASNMKKDHPFFLQVHEDVNHRLNLPHSDDEPAVQQRIYALSNLGNIATRKDLPVLKKHLKSNWKQIRAQAVKSLRNVPGHDVNQLVEDMFLNDKSEEVKKDALDVLLVNRHVSHAHINHLLSKLMDSNQKLSKIFTETLHSTLADPGNGTEENESFAPETLVSRGDGMTSDKFHTSLMLLQMKARAQGFSDGWFNGPLGYTGCTTCPTCCKNGCKKVSDIVKDCNCAVKNDNTRMPLPGSTQFFDPVFKRPSANIGNKNVGGGIYAEILAEACYPAPAGSDGSRPWQAGFSAEFGFFANTASSFTKVLALKASAIKDSQAGWGWLGPSVIVWNKQIDLGSIPGEKVSNKKTGKTRNDVTFGGINIDSCNGVLPIIIIPNQFASDEGNNPMFGKGKGKFMGAKSVNKADNKYQSTGTWTWGMSYEFRLAVVVKITLGFEVGFSLGFFIEPCSMSTGDGQAMVGGIDPAVSAGVTVTGGLDAGVVGVSVGITLNFFEVHLPPTVTFWLADKRPAKKFCPTVYISMEMQAVWYLLSGKFFIQLQALWGLFNTNLYEYYFPAGPKNTGSWFFQGSIPLWFNAACEMQQSSNAADNNLFGCKLRSDDKRTLGTAFGGSEQAFPFSWKDAGTAGTCQSTACGEFSALSTNFVSNKVPAVPAICNGHGTKCQRYRPNGQAIDWQMSTPESSTVAACVCKPGWTDYQCSTEDSYGNVRVGIMSGTNFGNLSEEEEELVQENGKAKARWGAGDPYCKVTVNGQSVQSPYKSSTNSPVWNNYHDIGGSAFVTKGAGVTVKCWDSDYGSDDYYGQGSFTLSGNSQDYYVNLYGGESGANYNGHAPNVKIWVEVKKKDRTGKNFQHVAMEKSWMTTGKKDFPKPKGAGEDCIVTAMAGEDMNGEKLQVTNVPRCHTRSVMYDSKVSGSVSSFKLSEGCQKVKLWDQDGCRENYSDNVVITKNAKYGRRRRRFNSEGGKYAEVPWDLNDDVCAITVTGKC